MLKDYIKDDIDKGSFTIENDHTIEIPNGKYLSEIFKTLPNGRIDKQATGIGATYMELNAERNSIIVEPTKAIASTKAHKTKDSLYIGSPTVLHSSLIKKADIIAYHNNPKIQYKKFVVVADSLPKVIDAIGEKVYESYYFMIDEIDSFQTESSYRPKLEKCIDYYFKFKNRSLVSATMKEFTNPEILKNPLYTIKQNRPQELINLIETNHPVVYTTNTIVKYLDNPKEKLLIALNSVTKIVQIIGLLSPEQREDCSVLCSEASKEKCTIDKVNYYQELVNDKLPTKVNFITSAYFTGVDIDESCSIIIVTDNLVPYTLLNVEKVKQVIGRSRQTTSNISLVKSAGECNATDYSLDKILKSAQRQMKALNCVTDHFEGDDYLFNSLDSIREGIISNSRQGINCKLTRKTVDKDYQIAYFNIDSFISEQETQNSLYCSSQSLKEALEDANYSVIDTLVNVAPTQQQLQLLDEVEKTIKESNNDLILEAIEEIENDTYNIYEAKGVKNRVFQQYEKLEPYLEKEKIIEKIKEFKIDKRDSRELNNFYNAVLYQSLGENHSLKKQLSSEFIIGKSYTPKQIKTKLNKVFNSLDAGLATNVESETQSVKILKQFFGTKKGSKKIDGKRIYHHKIENDNPKEIILKEGYTSPEASTEWTTVFGNIIANKVE